ncbi:UNVERIFIED_ORG: AcrR family transcriptional regulator [Xanthobacter viscosus]|uniref:TetR/AcrR family transcriptional regulator n=1 Tax=Xanthobacter autotrophicus TaxID=280 RepID=UPI001476ED8D|nr:TetR/AcrR family transcriptional regulator [Xanthobacter autotrophicus]
MIIDTAAELFLDRGYEGVSIDAITALVGGSKRDIYALFGDKETLFRRAVEKLATERADLFREVPLSDDLRAALTSIGLKIIEVLLSPRALALHRLIISEAARAPNASEAFLTNAPLRAYETVAQLLRQHAAKGDVLVPDADISARIFVGALVQDLQLWALLGKAVSETEQRVKAEAVVQHFLDGIDIRRGKDVG